MDKINNISTGASILAEWLGEGGIPVDHERAQGRADLCLCCPLNVRGNWLDRVTAAVAEAIRKQRAEKTQLGLVVSGEEMLGTCSACSCHLPLKIWVPRSIIVSRTKPETFQQLHQDCWILNEQ